jgi:hypothetical protein
MEERGSEMILRKIATEGTREKASEIAQALFGSIAGAGIEYAPACWNAVVVGPQGDSDYQSMGYTHPSRSTVYEARYFQQGCEVSSITNTCAGEVLMTLRKTGRDYLTRE